MNEFKGAYFQEGVEHEVVDCELVSFDVSNAEYLPSPYLASIYGGQIGATVDADGALKPNDTIYKVTLRPSSASHHITHISRGLVVMQGENRSLLSRAWRKVASVLIRESGF